MVLSRLVVLVLMACIASPVLAENPACQRKVVEIEMQIKHAKKVGNHHRVRGLERALLNTKMRCADVSLISDKSNDIAEQQEDVDEQL